MKKVIALIFTLSIGSTSAIGPLIGPTHLITVENKLNTPIYAVVYHTNKDNAVRYMEPIPCAATDLLILRAPKPRIFKKRMLFVSTDKSAFKKMLSKEEVISLDIAPADLRFARTNCFLLKNDQLTRIEHVKKKALTEYLRDKVLESYPQRNKVAHVRQHINEPGAEEKAYITKRRNYGRITLQKLLKRHISPTVMPSISTCISGGSMRAMFGSFGMWNGLKKIGLLDSVLYNATLSGSCWGPVCWLAEKSSLEDFIASQIHRYKNVESLKKLLRRTMGEFRSLKYTRSLFGNSTSFGHWFGLMLSKVMLKPITDHYQKMTLSGLAKNLDHRRHPYPLMTAVMRSNHARDMSYHWIEHTPYDTRLSTGEYCIPTWASMRRFENGVSIDNTPELRLTTLFGIWGAAFNLSLDEFIIRLPEKIWRWIPREFVNKILRARATHKKLLLTKVPNFAYQLPNKDLLHSNKDLVLADAGFASNIPIPPLLHAGREPDLLIVFNASITEGNGIDNIFEFRQLLKQRFPKITFDVDTLMGQPISYWPSKDLGTPNIIVVCLHTMPSFDPDYDPRTIPIVKFNYTPKEIADLTGLVSHIVVKNKNIFMQAVKDTIEKRELLLNLYQRATSRIKSWFIR